MCVHRQRCLRADRNELDFSVNRSERRGEALEANGSPGRHIDRRWNRERHPANLPGLPIAHFDSSSRRTGSVRCVGPRPTERTRRDTFAQSNVLAPRFVPIDGLPTGAPRDRSGQRDSPNPEYTEVVAKER